MELYNVKYNNLENKLNETIGIRKEVCKTLKSLGVPDKTSSCDASALRVNKTTHHDNNLVSGKFKDYYSNLAGNLLKKLSLFQSTITHVANVVCKYLRKFPGTSYDDTTLPTC